ncbi:MAG TPA: DUF4956 domain-containing protein [Bacteroidales bacterium]|nr:DUF4956 domain-containing protein [Bacteroidales bacterium]
MNTINLLATDKIKIAGMEIFDLSNLLELIGRFSFNLIVILILVRWLYFSTSRRKDYLFTYILISSIVFLLCFLLENVMLQIGFALGLFAIFGIIRYRTHTIPIKEMTYLFLIIGISVINALTNTTTSFLEIVFTNFVIILITYGLEKRWLLKHESSKKVIYEKINLIKPEYYDELLDDLQKRTGIEKISRVEIGEIDLLRDICHLKVFFETTDKVESMTNKVGHQKDSDEE